MALTISTWSLSQRVRAHSESGALSRELLFCAPVNFCPSISVVKRGRGVWQNYSGKWRSLNLFSLDLNQSNLRGLCLSLEDPKIEFSASACLALKAGGTLNSSFCKFAPISVSLICFFSNDARLIGRPCNHIATQGYAIISRGFD